MHPHGTEANQGAHLKVPAGTVIFEENTEGEEMFVVIQGEVLISLHGKPLAVATAGEVVGEMAMLKSKTRSATATAQTDCELDPIDKERFQLMIQQSPSFALYVMNLLAERLRITNELLTS